MSVFALGCCRTRRSPKPPARAPRRLPRGWVASPCHEDPEHRLARVLPSLHLEIAERGPADCAARPPHFQAKPQTESDLALQADWRHMALGEDGDVLERTLVA